MVERVLIILVLLEVEQPIKVLVEELLHPQVVQVEVVLVELDKMVAQMVVLVE